MQRQSGMCWEEKKEKRNERIPLRETRVLARELRASGLLDVLLLIDTSLVFSFGIVGIACEIYINFLYD
jgi:hypothetical protein